MRFRRIAPWFAAASTVVGVAFAFVLNALAGSHGEDTWTGVPWSAGAVELASQGGFGYLLKCRVLPVAGFLDAAERVAKGGSALDPKVVASPASERCCR